MNAFVFTILPSMFSDVVARHFLVGPENQGEGSEDEEAVLVTEEAKEIFRAFSLPRRMSRNTALGHCSAVLKEARCRQKGVWVS